jgi:hypothetical protein
MAAAARVPPAPQAPAGAAKKSGKLKWILLAAAAAGAAAAAFAFKKDSGPSVVIGPPSVGAP